MAQQTMTQLKKVLYTATAHTTSGGDGASHSDDSRLDVKLSTPGNPGTGTNPKGNHSPEAEIVLPRRRMIMSAVSLAQTGAAFLPPQQPRVPLACSSSCSLRLLCLWHPPLPCSRNNPPGPTRSPRARQGRRRTI